MKKINYIILIILTISFWSCENEELDALRDRANNNVVLPDLTAGDADFSNYVSFGPSFTAGFTDGSVFIAGQENSFPNILAQQFANAGGGEFIQPLVSDNFGGLAAGGTRISDPRLVFGGAGPVPLEAVVGPVTVGTDIVLNNPTGPFNNLGVPGAKSFHFIANGYGNFANFPNANPYAVRITGSTPDASLLEIAVAQNPTFFTADLLGGNDVLGYATNGGDASLDQITPTPTFERFVMVSTDKAVNPTNVMGATKRAAEIYIGKLSLSGYETKFMTTRFGNVLGSNGSVIPLFKEQIKKGGPLTLTHKDIIRYFMTIPEASQLVIEAGITGEGGEIFVFDMGKPIKIYELAKNMIKLSGLKYPNDIDIKITGLRPGEKLFEELLTDKESTLPTHHQKINIAKINIDESITSLTKINNLINLINTTSSKSLVNELKLLIPEYKSQNSIYQQLDD